MLFSFFIFLWLRQESNLDLELRKLSYYPLYYEAIFSFRKSAKLLFYVAYF